LRRFQEGQSPEEIAEDRSLAISTIYSHLIDGAEAGETLDLEKVFTSDEQSAAEDAFKKLGFANLTGVFEFLGSKADYNKLKLFRAVLLKKIK
jgi:ATP-dependent DNA helicase RecQ